METPYFARPIGSSSKLQTTRGARIFATIVNYWRKRPLAFFSAIAAVAAAFSIFLAAPIFVTYAKTAWCRAFLMILAFLSLVSAFILDSVRHGRLETPSG